MSFLTKLLGGIATFGTGGLAGPLISAGASLLGGALNNKAEKAGIAAQNAYNDPAQIRARAEAAGFNPISFIGPGVGNQTAAASGAYMGSAIADAGMAIADGIANRTKRKQAEQLGALEIENAKLQNKLMQLTLRPKVGGVYAQRETTPTIAAAVGGGNAAAANSGLSSVSASVGAVVGAGDAGSGDLRPLPASSPVDKRRKVDHKAVPSSAGFVVIDNPNLDYPVYIPSLDGDETMGPDYITVPLAYWASGVYHRYQKNQAQPKVPSAGHVMPDDKATRLRKAWKRMGWPTGAPVVGWGSN